MLIVINKWDLIEEKDERTINDFKRYFDKKLPFAKWVPMIFVSALEKQRVKNVLDLALEVDAQSKKHINKDELQEIIIKITNKYKPKQRQVTTFGQRKKDLVLKSLKQIDVNPPVFRLRSSTPKNVPEAIVKLIEKEIRERYEFLGVPIKITVTK